MGVCEELMLLGFISLLLTVGQGPISNICISKKVGDTWHPCGRRQEDESTYDNEDSGEEENRRKLLSISATGSSLRRILAAGEDKCAAKVRLASLFGVA